MNLPYQLHQSFSPFIYLVRTGVPGSGRSADDEDEEELTTERPARQSLQSGIANATGRFNGETLQYMREYVLSGSDEKMRLVQRLLDGEEMNEAKFNTEYQNIATTERSWSEIFKTQREVRKKIYEVVQRLESYTEFIPRQKNLFEGLLKEAHKFNKMDDDLDREVRGLIARLTEPIPQQGGAPLPPLLPDKKEADELYSIGLGDANYASRMKYFAGIIKNAPRGDYIFKKIVAFKKDEVRLEKSFERINRELTNIVINNVSLARKKVERKQILNQASSVVGITLREGTELEFKDSDLAKLPEGATGVSISKITFDPIEVRDEKGKLIDTRDGPPIIYLSNGAKLTLARFKKWVDAADVVEVAKTKEEVEIKTGLFDYGIKIFEGMEVQYLDRVRSADNKMYTKAVFSRIDHIETNNFGGRIFFTEPVKFHTNVEGSEQFEMRQSLTFGEFAKWWRRSDAEKSLSKTELFSMLAKYNKLENEEFDLKSSENPQIEVVEGEVLKYPDDSGNDYSIQKVDDDGVVLDALGKKNFSEFFNWVKRNHVRKAPGRKKSKEQIDEDIHLKKHVEHDLEEAVEKRVDQLHLGAEKQKAALDEMKRVDAGSPLEQMVKAWHHTTFLSFQDVWKMIKEVVEFVKRKHDRRSKGRFGKVGTRIPGVLGTEFHRIEQEAETGEVNKYKEPMEQWSIFKIQRTLRETNDKDEAKAAIMTLVHKGEFRFDDHHMWKTMNRLTKRYTLKGDELYIPEHMPQGKNAEDIVIKAMDALWGEGTGAEWYSENTNKFNSLKKNFEYQFKQLENDPKGNGGPAGECTNMLKDWRSGQYVSPHKYEAMIDGAIKFGKMGAEDKMFFIIAGITMRFGDDPHGETLLHIDRLGEFNSQWLNQFPLLDYFTQVKVTDYSLHDDAKGEWGKDRKLVLEDFQDLVHRYFPNDYKDCEAGPQFSRFLWENMIMEDSVRTRISKGIRNAENMDHDDAHLFIPPASPSEIMNLLTGPSGQKKYFTNAGYMNAYGGFNQFILSLSYAIDSQSTEEGREKKITALKDSLNSFILYDLTLSSKYKRKEGDRYARLDPSHYSKHPVVEPKEPKFTVKQHQEQLRNLILDVGKAYNQDFSWIYREKYSFSQEREQKNYEQRIEGLKETFAGMIESDGGQKALHVIKDARSKTDLYNTHGLRGLMISKRPNAEQLEALREHYRKHKEDQKAHAHGGH